MQVSVCVKALNCGAARSTNFELDVSSHQKGRGMSNPGLFAFFMADERDAPPRKAAMGRLSAPPNPAVPPTRTHCGTEFEL
jgi:hypothetical protein